MVCVTPFARERVQVSQQFRAVITCKIVAVPLEVIKKSARPDQPTTSANPRVADSRARPHLGATSVRGCSEARVVLRSRLHNSQSLLLLIFQQASVSCSGLIAGSPARYPPINAQNFFTFPQKSASN